ncbi:spore protease YyaC [Anaeromicrobium sediminis]|uniref:Spore protease YyaC n=1 Tax=Anaeromicrobium sediminis TaxID=1478221 RepID=A0A267MG54_9FIRM|nr:spore protease YyaC [Anaeromicrobium sediminis]PAB58447.1 spore protease YyaC [Anaeromicrobium sediminis]
MFDKKLSTPSIDVNGNMPYLNFNRAFKECFETHYTDSYEEIIIMCIGTDRSTGDSLGPLVGYKLERYSRMIPNFYVHGTLDNPVHAKNLKDSIEDIYSNYNKPFVIAIDACLGKSTRIGHIKVGSGSIRPGAGVNKSLPAVGDIYVTGIVNLSGFMEYIVLQNTRLNLVMKMADTISEGIRHCLWSFNKPKQSNLF